MEGKERLGLIEKYYLSFVNFITHDVIDDMLSRKVGSKLGEVFSEYHMGTIEIFDNGAIVGMLYCK